MTGKTQEFFTAMWQTIFLRGIASLVFGVLAFVYPGVTLAVLVTIFGIYALVDGLAGLWSAFRGGEKGRSIAALLQAIASVAAGLACLIFPAFATVYVVLLIGLWNIAAGALQVIGAVALRNEIANAMPLVLAGLLGIVLGLLIVFNPLEGMISIIWIIAATAVIVGLVLMVFALKLRQAAAQKAA